MEIEEIRKERRKLNSNLSVSNTNEFFTPKELVNKMLDKLPEEVFKDLDKTFLDNSAGNGNFIIEIFKRKFKYCHSSDDIYRALNSIYATELMKDNVEEIKSRILSYIRYNGPAESLKKAEEILDKNIICTDAFKWDYDNWKPKYEEN